MKKQTPLERENTILKRKVKILTQRNNYLKEKVKKLKFEIREFEKDPYYYC